jgi:hypothetical protein
MSHTPLQQSEFCTQKEPSGAQLPPELLPLPLLLPVLPLLPLPLLPLLLPPLLEDPPEPEPPRLVFVPDESPLPPLNDPSAPPSSPVDEAFEVQELGGGPPEAHPFAAAITRQNSAASIPINNLELMATWPSGLRLQSDGHDRSLVFAVLRHMCATAASRWFLRDRDARVPGERLVESQRARVGSRES